MTPFPDSCEDKGPRISKRTLRVMERALERVDAGEVGEQLDPDGLKRPDDEGE